MDSNDNPFLKSVLTHDGALHSMTDFERWFELCQKRYAFQVEKIPFCGLEKWAFEATTGNLVHSSGKFFKIEGVSVETNFGGKTCWTQPIIHQPEIGILGFLTKRFGGVLHFLVQAKMEPGNIRMVQIAPTLQATRSNYTRVHGGKTPPYMSFFSNRDHLKIWVDILQSEQGARFLRKRNRNMIVEVSQDAEVPISDDYYWLTLGQLHQLMKQANVVNMDARSVLSCITYESGFAKAQELGRCQHETGVNDALLKSVCSEDSAAHSSVEVISWFTEQKTRYDLNVERIPMKHVHDWIRTDMDIHHESDDYFKIIAVRVAADNREVPAWTQPLVQPIEAGIVAFVAKPIQDVLHFLMQAKVEPGNFDVVEMAPTVQCLTGSYRRVPQSQRPPFLEYVLNAQPQQIMLDTMQSEEGGRFFREENRNMVILAGADLPTSVPDNYIWMTMGQIKRFIQYNNFVNVQARCLLACLGVS